MPPAAMRSRRPPRPTNTSTHRPSHWKNVPLAGHCGARRSTRGWPAAERTLGFGEVGTSALVRPIAARRTCQRACWRVRQPELPPPARLEQARRRGVRAVRSGVGIMDLPGFTRLLIEGPELRHSRSAAVFAAAAVESGRTRLRAQRPRPHRQRIHSHTHRTRELLRHVGGSGRVAR